MRKQIGGRAASAGDLLTTGFNRPPASPSLTATDARFDDQMEPAAGDHSPDRISNQFRTFQLKPVTRFRKFYMAACNVRNGWIRSMSQLKAIRIW